MKPISLTRFLIEEQREKQHARPDLRLLIELIAREVVERVTAYRHESAPAAVPA